MLRFNRLKQTLSVLDVPENAAHMQAVHAALAAFEEEYRVACQVADAALAYRECDPDDNDKRFSALVDAVRDWAHVRQR